MFDRVRKSPVILILFISCCATAHAQDSVTRPIAVVDGVSISAQEVESAAAEALTQLEFRRTQFEIEMKRERESALENALDRILTSRVLAVEAAKRRITIEELLEIEVNSAAPPPSDEAVVQFYNANRAAFEGSPGDHTASIRNYLRAFEATLVRVSRPVSQGPPRCLSMVEFSLEISPLARSGESSRMSCGVPASNRRETVGSMTILFVDC